MEPSAKHVKTKLCFQLKQSFWSQWQPKKWTTSKQPQELFFWICKDTFFWSNSSEVLGKVAAALSQTETRGGKLSGVKLQNATDPTSPRLLVSNLASLGVSKVGKLLQDSSNLEPLLIGKALIYVASVWICSGQVVRSMTWAENAQASHWKRWQKARSRRGTILRCHSS